VSGGAEGAATPERRRARLPAHAPEDAPGGGRLQAAGGRRPLRL